MIQKNMKPRKTKIEPRHPFRFLNRRTTLHILTNQTFHISTFVKKKQSTSAMMKVLLPFALFFLTSVKGNLRGDLSHDDNRDLKKCKRSKFVSLLLFVAALFRWLERQRKGSHMFTIFTFRSRCYRLQPSAGFDATYTSKNRTDHDASYASGTSTYACVLCSTHGD
jgi:hypothetical protein